MSEPDTAGSPDLPSENGWTNEYVRDGFAVDGSADQALSIPKKWLLLYHKYMYELLGHTLYAGVIRRLERLTVYPLVRAFNSIRGREQTAEQYIAETEYIYATVVESGRGGIGSTYWLLGLITLMGPWLVALGLGWTAGSIGEDAPILTGLGVVVIIGGVTTLIGVRVALKHTPSID